jgi:hypothetical protein
MFTKKKLDIRDEENDPRNIHVNMYNYTKNFKKFLGTTLTITVIAFGILIIGLTGAYYGFEDRISESGTYIELYGSDCEGRGYEPTSEQTCLLFVPSDGGAPLGVTVGELINHHYIVAGWIVLGCIVLAIALIWTIVYSRKMKEPLDDTLHEYIQESYFLNIQLTSPKGTTRAERIANLLWSVFPEVYSVSDNISAGKETTKIPYSINEKKAGYVFDLYMEAEGVKFGAIFFEGVFTLKKLKEFTDSVNGDFTGDDDRVICIAKKFDVGLSEIAAMPADAELEEDDLLDEQFNGLNVDILKEDNNNQFSIVWIS